MPFALLLLLAPGWVPLARQLHLLGMALASLLLLDLVGRLARTGLWRSYPLFMLYLLVCCCRALQGYIGIGDWWFMASESVLVLTRLLALLEGAIKLFARPRVPALLLLLSLAVAYSALTLLLPAEPNPVREFERYKQAANVGLGAFMLAGMGWVWVRGLEPSPVVREYWHIWALRMVFLVGIGFVNYPSASAEEGRWARYYWCAGVYLASCYWASWLWLRWAESHGPP
jgi:hypothetical protein